MTTPNTPNRNTPNDRGNADETGKNKQQGDLGGRQAAGAGGNDRSNDRSNEARTSLGSGSSSSSASSPRDGNDRSASGGASRGGNDQAIECLASALEVVIREMPRGTSAKLESAQEHLRQAREQLGSGGDRSASSGHASRSSETSSGSKSGRNEPGRSGEQDRHASGRDDESRKAPGRDEQSS